MNKRKLVRDFVKSIDKDFKISFVNTFEVDIPEEHIYATFLRNPELDKIYLDFLENEFGEKFNMFLMSLLHEIGHIMTYDDDLNDARDIFYGMLKLNFDEDKSDITEYNNLYFKIPMEYEATYWGVQYYRNNREKCDRLIKMLGV